MRHGAGQHAIVGFLAIHASKRWTKAEREYVAYFKERFPALRMSLADELPLGCVVAAVDLVAVHRVEDIRDSLSKEERAFGNYDNGRYAWELKVVKLPDAPIPAKGQQGLWEWNNE